MRVFVLIALLCLSACSWFGSRKPAPPDAPEIIVTGAPANSIVYVDGVQAGQLTEIAGRPQKLNVAAGSHKVEVRKTETVVYHEDIYVGPGERRVITVESGNR